MNVDPFQPNYYTLKKKIAETSDTFSLTLESNNATSFTFKPGQFNMLHAFGIGESAISLSSSPDRTDQFTHTIRAVGQATSWLTNLQPKQVIAIRGPFGQGWPMDKVANKNILIIAGGIGLAPLKPVILSLLANNQYQNLSLLYGARTPEDVLFKKELIQWRKKFNCQVTVDQGTRTWPHHIGVVTTLIEKNLPDPAHTIVMMCGPEIMMHFCLITLFPLGIPLNNIYLSLERNMQCGFGQCGHCQWGSYFICKDGPVMCFQDIEKQFYKKAL